MAKSKGGPTFFEILRSSGRPSSVKSQALESKRAADPVPPVAKSAPITPSPEPLDLERELRDPAVARELPPPIPAKALKSRREETFGPDTAGLRISYTVALFAALVGVAALLGSFCYGVRYGRNMVQSPDRPAAPVAAQEKPAPSAPKQEAPVAKWWTIKLYSWACPTEKEKTSAAKSAQDEKKALLDKGFKDVTVQTNAREIVLLCGKFNDRTAAKNTLDALRGFEYNGRFYFAKADFVPSE